MSKDLKYLLRNIGSLTVFQAVNLFLPLVTVPYIVRIIGVEKYGLIAIAMATSVYINILIEYGFNLSATQKVARNRNNKEILNEAFSAVLIIKAIIFSITTIVLGTILYLPFWKISNKELILLAYLIPASNVILPKHVYFGLGQVNQFTITSVISKIGAAIAILTLVNTKDDYSLVLAINGVASMLTSIVLVWYMIKYLNVRLVATKIETIKSYIGEGWSLFVSTLATNIYSSSATIFLAILSGPVAAGYFAGADRIIQAVKGMLGPIFQATYPYVAEKMQINKDDAIIFTLKLLKITSIITISLAITIVIFHKEISEIILGNAFSASANLLLIMAPLPFLVGASNVLGTQLMLNLDMRRQFLAIVATASIAGLCINAPMIAAFSEVGAALTVVIVEFAVTIAMSIFMLPTLRAAIIRRKQ
jgi:PST family polysaccharide transporter